MLNYIDMKGKNRYIKNAHISERKFKEILKCFCSDLTAKQTSEITKINRNTINRYFNKFRERIVRLCQIDSPFQGEIEVDENYMIVKNIIESIDKINLNAKIIMVTNPVDILTRVAIKLSKRDKKLIFGSGTVLDSIRLREAIGEKIGVNRKNIHAYVIGEHGDSEFPLWSACHIGPVELESFNIEDLEQFKIETAKKVKNRAYEIIAKKGFTKQAIGTSVANIIKSILFDERTVFTVSVPVENVCGCVKEDVCLSLPYIIGKNGIERKLLLKCNDDEFELLKKGAKKLDEVFNKINFD